MWPQLYRVISLLQNTNPEGPGAQSGSSHEDQPASLIIILHPMKCNTNSYLDWHTGNGEKESLLLTSDDHFITV